MTAPLDRATIAEIAARYGATIAPDLRAQVIPRGVSGIPLPVWVPLATGGGQLVNAPDTPNKWRKALNRHQSARSKKSAETRQRIADLHAQGMDDDEICAALGMGPTSLKVIRCHMRLKANPRKTNPVEEKRAADTEALRSRVAKGLTLKQAAAEIGMAYPRARHLAATYGIRSVASRGSFKVARDQAARAIDLHEQGLAAWQIIEALGCTVHTLRGITRRKGIIFARPWSKPE